MQKITVTAIDGKTISATVHNLDDSGAKGIVVICHGFGEHGAMYVEVAETLGQAGYACVLFDQRGHGAPHGTAAVEGGRTKHFGVTPGYGSFLDDVLSVTAAARQIAPGLPIALYGHSMGGNIVINTLLSGSGGYACAILEAPWIGLYKEHSPLITGFARVAGKISPRLTTMNKLKPELLTSEPERMKNYLDDPLYHGRISFRMFTGISDGCSYAVKNAAKLPVPVFLAYAENDKVLSSDATLRFAAAAGELAEVRGYGSRHAIHNDSARAEFFHDVIEFLDGHCR